MNKIVKTYGMPAILICALVFGGGSYFSRTRALKELTFKDGLYQQAVVLNAQVTKDKEKEIKGLQAAITVLEKERKEFVLQVNESTGQLRTVRQTQTDLEVARKTLVNLEDIVVNQDLQIQEFKKERVLQEKRFTDLREAYIRSEAAKKAFAVMAKDYFDELQEEKTLHQLSVDAYADYKSKVVSRQFKITIKGVGEKILYAAAGYGLGKVTG